MRKLLLIAAILLLPSIAQAQVGNAFVVTSCGTPPSTYVAGTVRAVLIDLNGNVCSNTGGGGSSTPPYGFTPLTAGQHNLAITTSTALTVPATATFAEVCARGNNVNFTTDGTTTPTSSVGMPLAIGQCQFFSGATVLANFRAIQAAATATLDAEYFK